jgi:hypothetical protein
VLVSAIEKNAKTFATLMRDYETNKEDFGLELARCETNLKLIKASVGGGSRSSIRVLLRLIRAFNGQYLLLRGMPKNSRDDAWGIYKPLNGLIEELRNRLEEQRMGG